ncbi:DNA polymerase [Ktedonospora formicarum]|uniref:DNA polymerase I n=1 Tax=Ktedonospora formicarum TaxID=2778364 RepID=A0A8J3I314_9CHLR|nr:DNA polymerase [Ktedonospora formicarum]GHO44554.1 hypothetical protein KSX_27170 [Ktedonospora formicarum]
MAVAYQIDERASALSLSDVPVMVTSDLKTLKWMVAVYAKDGSPVAFDTETDGFNPRHDSLHMMQFLQADREKVVIFDCRPHRGNLKAVGKILFPLFERCLAVGANLKFDYKMLYEQCGIKINQMWDVILADQVIEGLGQSDADDKGKPMSLKGIMHRYYGVPMDKKERSWFVKLTEREDEYNAPYPENIVQYGARDVAKLCEIMESQKAELERRKMMQVLDLELKVSPVLAHVELAGISVDRDEWAVVIEGQKTEAEALYTEVVKTMKIPLMKARARIYDQELEEWAAFKAAKAEREAYLREQYTIDPEGLKWQQYQKKHMGKGSPWKEKHPTIPVPHEDNSEPNLNSAPQVKMALWELGIKVKSTDKKTLEKLTGKHEFIKIFLKYRKAEKFLQSFGYTLLEKIDPATGRIHPEYVQIGASTGRMSCKDPNWQQIPSKGIGQILRSLVKSMPGMVMLTADFSNIELRILAELSQDKLLLKMFADGLDLHSETAYNMWKLDRSVDVKTACIPGTTMPYRSAAKTLNFALVYGTTEYGLADQLGVSTEEAANIIKLYFDTYTGVAAWLEKVKRDGLKYGYSLTKFGRKRYIDEIGPEPVFPVNNRTPQAIKEWRDAKRSWEFRLESIKRQLGNSPIQGLSADITKWALVFIHEHLDYTRAAVVAVVHDEIVIESTEDYAEEAARIQAEAMDKACKLFLKTVVVPPTHVEKADHWVK